jgi:transposase
MMGKRDGRTLDHKTLEEIRIRAVQRVEASESPEDVIRREGGIDALRAKPISGRPSKMTGRQLEWVYKTVTGKNPLQLRFEFALWTRSMIRELIREKFGVRLSEVSVGRMLRKLGLSPQRPLRRAYERDPELVKSWREKEFPKIRRLAKKERATLYFSDEAGVRSDFHAGTTWAPKGQTPVVPATGQRFGMNLISAISPRGDFRFMTVDGRMNAGSDRRSPSIASRQEGARVRAIDRGTPPALLLAAVRTRSESRRTRLEPPGHMRSLQRLPDVIRGFFRDPHLRYILE